MDKKRAKVTYLMVGGVLVLAAWAASAMPKRTAPKTLNTTDNDNNTQKPPITQVVVVTSAKSIGGFMVLVIR